MDLSFETILRIKQKIVSKEKWAISGNSLTWNCEGKGFMGVGGGGGTGVLEERGSLIRAVFHSGFHKDFPFSSHLTMELLLK